MKNNLVGKMVYWREDGRCYRVAYVFGYGHDEIVIEHPNGWSVSKVNNKLLYENMLSTKKKYWIITDYDAVSKTINNE